MAEDLQQLDLFTDFPEDDLPEEIDPQEPDSVEEEHF